MEELVARVKKGDETAFDELIMQVKQQLYLIAKTQLKEDDDIADAIQNTIILCYKNIKKLKDNMFFKTWIIKILLNECKKIYKKNKNKDYISLDEKNIEIKSEENFDKNIGFDILIKNLENEEQLLLTLYYCSQYTTKEISKILKIKENTIRSKISRAKTKLKNKLKENVMNNIDELLKFASHREVIIPPKIEYRIQNTLRHKKRNTNNWRYFMKKFISVIISIIGILIGSITVYAVAGGKISGKPVFEWIGVKVTDQYEEYRVEEKQELAYGETKIDLVSSMCDDGITILEFDVKLSEKDREYLRLDKSIVTEEAIENAKKRDEEAQEFCKKYNITPQRITYYEELMLNKKTLNTIRLTFFNIKENDTEKESYTEDGSCDLLVDNKKIYTTTNQTVTKISDYEYKVYQMYFLPDEKIKDKKSFKIKLENIMLENYGDLKNSNEIGTEYYFNNDTYNERKIKIDGSFEINVSKEKASNNTIILTPNVKEIKYKNMIKKVEEVKITPMQIIVKVSSKIDKVSLNTLEDAQAKDHISFIDVTSYDEKNNVLSTFAEEIKRTITYSNGKTEEWARGDIGTFKNFSNATMNLTEYYIIEKKDNIESLKIDLNEWQDDFGKELKNIGNFDIKLN